MTEERKGELIREKRRKKGKEGEREGKHTEP
jgi:hypothetical protein